MIGALRDFVRRLGAQAETRHFERDDQRLALAALLVHCVAIDGSVSPRRARRCCARCSPAHFGLIEATTSKR